MFNSDIVIKAEDLLLDILDMVSDKFNYLITQSSANADEIKSADELLKMSDEERFDASIEEMNFNIAISSISLFRYITDVIDKVPVSVQRQIVHTKDMICQLVYLMEASPWIRQRKDKIERFDAGQWNVINKDDLIEVSKVEGQLWLALMNLCLDPESRKTYHVTTHKQAVISRLKNYISEQTVDQLPPLVDLQRFLEELLIMTPPEMAPPSLGIMPVSDIQTNLLNHVDLKQVAQKALGHLMKRGQKERETMATR